METVTPSWMLCALASIVASRRESDRYKDDGRIIFQLLSTINAFNLLILIYFWREVSCFMTQSELKK